MDKEFIDYCFKNYDDILRKSREPRIINGVLEDAPQILEEEHEKFCQLIDTEMFRKNNDFFHEKTQYIFGIDDETLNVFYNVSVNDAFVVCKSPCFSHDELLYFVSSYKLGEDMIFNGHNISISKKTINRKMLKEKISNKYVITNKVVFYSYYKQEENMKIVRGTVLINN